MTYVGCGQGDYRQEITYKYVGFGGDFDVERPRDFTCVCVGCGLLGLLLLIPLLLWLLMPDTSTRDPYDCRTRDAWSPTKKAYCCSNYGIGCPTKPTPRPPTPQPPMPTPPTTPHTTPSTRPTPSTQSTTRGPLQLRGGCRVFVDSSEIGMVLPRAPPWLPDLGTYGVTAATRSLQLPRRLRELAGWVVCGQEGVVLRPPWQGLPRAGRVHDDFGTLRLHR